MKYFSIVLASALILVSSTAQAKLLDVSVGANANSTTTVTPANTNANVNAQVKGQVSATSSSTTTDDEVKDNNGKSDESMSSDVGVAARDIRGWDSTEKQNFLLTVKNHA